MREPPRGLAPLFGLVLSGGLSSRMGEDKGALIYHELGRQVDQRTFCADLLNEVCEEVFVSVSSLASPLSNWGAVSGAAPEPHYGLIVDEPALKGTGPRAGLLSAHAQFPEAAWLVLACDFPLVSLQSLTNLVAARTGDTQYAYAYQGEESLEPLFAIWEPEALHEFKESQIASPRKFLEASGRAHLIRPTQEPRLLTNCNSTSERMRLHLT